MAVVRAPTDVMRGVAGGHPSHDELTLSIAQLQPLVAPQLEQT